MYAQLPFPCTVCIIFNLHIVHFSILAFPYLLVCWVAGFFLFFFFKENFIYSQMKVVQDVSIIDHSKLSPLNILAATKMWKHICKYCRTIYCSPAPCFVWIVLLNFAAVYDIHYFKQSSGTWNAVMIPPFWGPWFHIFLSFFQRGQQRELLIINST